jgi:CBS domain-containing membrane protein
LSEAGSPGWSGRLARTVRVCWDNDIGAAKLLVVASPCDVICVDLREQSDATGIGYGLPPEVHLSRRSLMPGEMKVSDLMSAEVITLIEDETLAHAQRCMDRGRIRHLPVVRGRQLVGLVTHRDLLASSFSIFAEVEPTEQRRVFVTVPVAEAMHRDVVTVRPDDSVADAARILLDNKYGCLPVVDAKNELVGIVTEADFLRLTVQLLT